MFRIQKENLDLKHLITDQQFQEIQDLFEYQSFNKGDFIFEENEIIHNLYLIKTGLVKLSFTNDETNESILSFAFENWWETDFSAFLNHSKSVLKLQCLENTEVFKLNHDNYQKLINNYELANYFLEKSIRGHIANQNRILTLLTNSPKEKYEQFLKIYPTLAQRIPKATLALYLGVSRETLSRIYK